MKSTDREPGYYWVKFADEWQPAQYREGMTLYFWSLIDSENMYVDKDLDVIGPAILVP